jgi:signal transduction histidine kinase/ligand-binding sensor domain-containing protein/DNA-binding response OmpR family regulator
LLNRLLTYYASLLTAFLCFVFLAKAQPGDIQFNRIDVRDGLPHNQVNAILKDDQGFMWFGTGSGLSRYDGYQFKNFKHTGDSTSINENEVAQIFQGPEHKLWINTVAGFVTYDPRTERFDRNVVNQLKKLQLPVGRLIEINKDTHGNFWFVYADQGLHKYNSTTKKTTSYKSHHNQPNVNKLTSAMPDGSGNIWLVYDDGLLERIDAKTGRLLLTITSLKEKLGKSNLNFKLFADAQNDLWFYMSRNSENGVFYFNTKTNEWRNLARNARGGLLNNNIINGIAQDDKGFVWIGTDHGGINVIDKKTWTVQYVLNNAEDEKSLSHNSINSIYKDNTGVIWAGTFKKGVNFFHDNIVRFPLYRHKPSVTNSLPYDDINRFIEDAKGNLWIGTNGGGLVYFDRAKNTFKQYVHNAADPNSLTNDVIVSMLLDRQGKLWIGTYFGGLDCFDGNKFIHYRHNDKDPKSLADDRVWELYEDSQNRFWVGTLAGGLDQLDRLTNSFIHYKPSQPNSVHSAYISTIKEDRKGNLWIGTDRGIDILKKGASSFTLISSKEKDTTGLVHNNIVDLFEDSRGWIWIGTRAGLNLLNEDGKTFRLFTTQQGLTDNTILAIQEDNNGGLWISTPHGLSNLTVVKNAATGKWDFHFRSYDDRDGLQGKEFNENAAIKLKNGNLVFAGPNGFNIFSPHVLNEPGSALKIVLTDLQVFNKSVSIGEEINGKVILPQALSQIKKITLKYNQNVFSIGFAALDYLKAGKIKYAYKLEGFSKEWLTADATNRRATYTNLDPGTYRFVVKVDNGNGTWSEEEAMVQITVSPPFWRTVWAYLIYIIAIGGILYAARRITLQRAKLRFDIEQERKEAQRMHELDLLKIKFFTNISHEFRTPLSLILTPLERIIRQAKDEDQKKQLSLVQRNAKRLLNLVNQLLDFRKIEFQEFKVSLSEGDIIYFIKDLAHSFSDVAEKKHIQLTLQSSISSFVTLFDKDKLEKIVFNLLSNAFRFTPDQGKIQVRLDLEDDLSTAQKTIVIAVDDSGIGIPKADQERIFERFFQHETPGTIMNQGSGIGLAITKEFVKLLGGSIQVDSQPEMGSCFTVKLPLQAEGALAIVSEPVEEAIVVQQEPGDPGEETFTKKKKGTVLLVEDNDDFRFYLKDNLGIHYHVIEAVNGKEAWKKMGDSEPDLVVSDIMMPEMNGLELAKKIKSDPRTSHIPVVLLTAMASEEQQLEGFESGANDYITKPFSFEILLSRIKSLLNHRKQLRKLFQQQIEVNPSEITVTPVDEKFIKEALAAVEERISDPEFSVEEFSRKMHMSRAALYKKLVSITGKPPLEFIRSIRLKRAAQLLAKTDLSVSEVAYEVGFNNPKYFARYFKEEFGTLPSQYEIKKAE